MRISDWSSDVCSSDLQIAEYAFGDKSKVEFTCVTTANRIPSLVGGKIDLMIATMGITKKRAEVVGVSQPYAWGASDLLVPNDSPIKKLDDIKGKKIIVINGDRKSTRLNSSH